MKNTSPWIGRARRTLNGTKTRRATIASIMTGLAGQTVLIVTGVLAARILGVEGRGYLAMLTVFVALVAQIGGLGIPQATTFYISKTKGAREVLKQLHPLMLAQALLLLAAHIILVLVYTQEAPQGVRVAAFYTILATPGSLASAYGQAVLQGQFRFRLFNLLRLLPVASYAVLLFFLFVVDQGSLPTVAAVWSLSNLLTGFLVLHLSYTRLGNDTKSTGNTNIPSRKEIICFGLKGLLGWASPLDSFRIDQLMAGLMLSPSALGLYVVGQAFTNIPKFISQSIGMIAYPTISGKEDLKGIKRTIWLFVFASGVLNVFIVGVLWLVMPFLVRLFFGEAFMASTLLARILIIGALMLSFRLIIVECARGLGRPEISTYAELSMYPWLLISIPLLIIPFGITGMAYSVAAGQLVSLIVSAALVVRTLSPRDHVQDDAISIEKGINYQ